jgi:pimeloyl-ACP methyl ester carboxylesterase
MESSTSLFDVFRQHEGAHQMTGTIPTAPTTSGMKKSASQAYFDRYPERKGRGPYIPSTKLTTSTINGVSEQGGSERKDNGQATRLASARANEDERSASSSSQLYSPAADSEKRRLGRRVRPPESAERQPASTTPSSIDSYASTFFSGSSPGYAPPRQFAAERADVAAAAASRFLSGYPSLPSSHDRRTTQRDLLTQVAIATRRSSIAASDVVQSIEDEQMVKGLTMEQGVPPAAENTTPRRRLKAQQSMPNVRSPRGARERPDLPDFVQKPWPVASSSQCDTGRKSKPRGKSPFSRASSSNTASIEDIIRRNTPDIVLPRSASSKSDVFTQSLGRRSMLSKESSTTRQETEEGSDSSLDSIEREIQYSMRTMSSSDEGADRFRPLNSSESSKPFSTSPSSGLFGKKKASSSLFNPARRLYTLSAATTSSPGPSDSSPSSSRHLSKRHPPLSTSTATVSPSPIHQAPPRSPPSTLDQDDEIRSYLHSKKLTTLMTLSRQPFQGLSVSFADVGDPDGHPVFVFLGLGAVRYLVGLYDEMATVLHLRLICIDRWGLGRTDDLSAEKRGVLDWSSVVVEVADRLEIGQFSLLAHSAGAPYAMATCLVHEARIAGPVHLLAPWVGPTVESGYKWLKYVPDGVIKTAQAADWRMQAWKLGLGKSPLVLHSDDSNRSGSLEDGTAARDTCSPSPSLKSVDGALLPPTPTVRSLKKSKSSLLNTRQSSTFESGDWTLVSESDSASFYGPDISGNSDRSVSPAPPTSAAARSNGAEPRRPSSSRNPTDSGLKPLSFTPPQRPHFQRSPSAPWTTSLEESPVPSYSVSGLTTALMRASHAENLRGGATNDLLVILGRSSQKPWGFSYTDVMHNVIVWQGDKDERVSLSSILWMEREMKSCCVNLVKNASHGLMTNIEVVIEALER